MLETPYCDAVPASIAWPSSTSFAGPSRKLWWNAMMPVSSADGEVAGGLLGAEDDEIGDQPGAARRAPPGRPRRPSAAAAARSARARGRRSRRRAAARPHSTRPGTLIEGRYGEAQQRHQQRERGQRPGRRSAALERQQRRPRPGARGAGEHEPGAEPPGRRGGEDDVDAVPLREPAGDLDRDQRRPPAPPPARP